MAKKKKKSKNNSQIITIAIAVIVVAAAGYYFSQQNPAPQHQESVELVYVNGEAITQAELDTEFARLPDQYKVLTTKEDFLDQLITKKVLLQQAASQGINPTPQEIELQYEQLKVQFQSEEQLLELIAQQNLTLEKVKAQLGESLQVDQLFEQAVASIEVQESEMLAYYNQNEQAFNAPQGQVRARHILLQTAEKADEIKELLDAGANFEQLALQNSIDPSVSSNSGNLGFFGRGQMVGEFEDVAFSLKEDEISEPVQTQFGFHIIQRLPDTIAYAEIKQNIREALISDQQAIAIEVYVKQLREQADIQIVGEEQDGMDSSSSEPDMHEAELDTMDHDDMGYDEDHSSGEDSMQKESAPVEQQAKQAAKSEKFTMTSDALCMQDEKPIIRRYVSSNCEKCSQSQAQFYEAVSGYDVIVKELELDTGDDLVTASVETTISKEEFNVLKQYNPHGSVPFYVFGCQYVGSGADAQESDIRAILDELTK